MLWERCYKAIKKKIEERSDYIKIENNPLTLLIAIKEHALNYPEIILDAMKMLFTTKQKEGESLTLECQSSCWYY